MSLLDKISSWWQPTESDWLSWQKSQPVSHFQISEIFQHYLHKQTSFFTLHKSAETSYNSEYFRYCFGDFTPLIAISPISSEQEYYTMLLELYDICKGYFRTFTGDSKFITVLRTSLSSKDLTPLYTFDYNSFIYDYTNIHAHTVAYHSLSRLIALLISNQLSFTCNSYPYIDFSKCKAAYDNDNLSRKKKVATANINIPSKNIPVDLVPQSWPPYKEIYICKHCKKRTDKYYGNFNNCIDCYLKRVCSCCGYAATGTGADRLPKCEFHT